MDTSPDLAKAARAIAEVALSRDPGPMASAKSNSHSVYVGSDVVVKIIDVARHSRLNREIALAPHLPAGLTAPLLGYGIHRLETHESHQVHETHDVRYACYARVPGTTPGMGMRGVTRPTAQLLAEQAVHRLGELHAWLPAGTAEHTLREPLDHGGFTGRAALSAEIEKLAVVDQDGTVPRKLLDGLIAIAEHAPLRAQATVPVHADCHWGNWLASGRTLTALLDFEWARFGEPADDWFFLARFSGRHMETVLGVIARATTTSPELLRAQCEVREAAHIASDLHIALAHPGSRAALAAERMRGLAELVVGRHWWRRR